jgi:type IV pilus assembly protein PilA
VDFDVVNFGGGFRLLHLQQRNNMKKIGTYKNAGFTLVELMIVIAIIGILAAIAIPNYQEYTRKGKFTEIVAATAPYKLAVNLCYQDGACQGGTASALAVSIPSDRWGAQIPADTSTTKHYISSLTLSSVGVITATSVATDGLASRTYILTPTVNSADNSLTWAKSGTCTTSPAIC